MLWLLSAVLLYGLLAALKLLKVKGSLKWLPLMLRLGSLSLLIIALADPVSSHQQSSQHISVLFDVSASMSQKATISSANAVKELQSKLGETKLKVFPFAKHPEGSFEISPSDNASAFLSKLEAESKSMDRGNSNLEEALLRAESGESKTILLVSDGIETLGRSINAAESLSAKGFNIYPIISSAQDFLDADLSISSLYAPLVVKAGTQSALHISVHNSFDKERKANLELWIGNNKLFSKTIIVPAGKESMISIKSPTLKGGLKRLRAVLWRGDSQQKKQIISEKHRWISVKERSKILLLNGSKDDSRIFKRLLNLKGYATDSYIMDGSAKLPASFENLSSLVINNVAKDQLPKGFLPKLEKFVRTGGGLLIIGGDHSFGLGGYINTPLEAVSPLRFLPPRTKTRRLISGVVLVLDKSRSMLAQDKIYAAKQAALTAIGSLKPDDYVSVVGFDNAPFVIIRMDKVSKVRPIAEKRLRNLTAAGRTNLLPAMAEARSQIRMSGASRKHIIVLSDGKFPAGEAQYLAEINRAREAGITVSTVALGSEADVPFMRGLAQYGKGAFYHTLDPSKLPQIFMRDIKVSVGEDTMKERDTFPVSVGADGTRSTTLKNFPALKGFVKTLLKPTANLELKTSTRKRNYPVLASWRFGKGTVIAFTSDANGRWSLPWLHWKGFSKFWSQIVQSIKPKSGPKQKNIDFDLRHRIEGRDIILDLAIFDEILNTKASPKITATVLEPGEENTKVFFNPLTKGRYSAQIAKGRPGDYKLSINYGNTQLPPAAITIPGEAFGEHAGTGINLPTLSKLAKTTSSVINPAAKNLSKTKIINRNQNRLFIPLVVAGFFMILLESLIRENLLERTVFQHTSKTS